MERQKEEQDPQTQSPENTEESTQAEENLSKEEAKVSYKFDLSFLPSRRANLKKNRNRPSKMPKELTLSRKRRSQTNSLR